MPDTKPREPGAPDQLANLGRRAKLTASVGPEITRRSRARAP
jgi:hypothetical protein